MRRKGFTLVELIIAIMLLGILAGTMTLNPSSARQTAQKEAEKVAAFLSSAVQRADRMNLSFDVRINDKNDSLDIKWYQNAPQHMLNNPLQAARDCKYSFYSKDANNPLVTPQVKFRYSPNSYPNSVMIKTMKNEKTGYPRIKITGKPSDYYVIISGDYPAR